MVVDLNTCKYLVYGLLFVLIMQHNHILLSWWSGFGIFSVISTDGLLINLNRAPEFLWSSQHSEVTNQNTFIHGSFLRSSLLKKSLVCNKFQLIAGSEHNTHTLNDADITLL